MELGIQIEGTEDAVQMWCRRLPALAKWLLTEVTAFHPLLKLRGQEVTVKPRWPRVVRRMIHAVQEVDAMSLTPMAAVAGAISGEILDLILEESKGKVARVLVNNGGDLALYSPATSVRVGVRGTTFSNEKITVPRNEKPWGVATSGWRGRSFSLGIADAVVVVAPSAAVADAAATYVGNYVTLGDHPSVRREPAGLLDPETDIPELKVTVARNPLTPEETRRALKCGLEASLRLCERGVVLDAFLYLQGEKVRLNGGKGMKTL
jgi:ApbE superfamily uncharacterized protein (UPF0280 family)